MNNHNLFHEILLSCLCFKSSLFWALKQTTLFRTSCCWMLKSKYLVPEEGVLISDTWCTYPSSSSVVVDDFAGASEAMFTSNRAINRRTISVFIIARDVLIWGFSDGTFSNIVALRVLWLVNVFATVISRDYTIHVHMSLWWWSLAILLLNVIDFPHKEQLKIKERYSWDEMIECAFVIARNICLSLGAWEILQAPFSQTDNLIN